MLFIQGAFEIVKSVDQSVSFFNLKTEIDSWHLGTNDHNNQLNIDPIFYVLIVELLWIDLNEKHLSMKYYFSSVDWDGFLNLVDIDISPFFLLSHLWLKLLHLEINSTLDCNFEVEM